MNDLKTTASLQPWTSPTTDQILKDIKLAVNKSYRRPGEIPEPDNVRFVDFNKLMQDCGETE